MNIEKRIEVLDLIAKDVEDDVKEFEGKPFNGKVMAEYMGYHAASIKALADIIKSILEDMCGDEKSK